MNPERSETMRKLIPLLLFVLIVSQLALPCLAVSAAESNIDSATYDEFSTIIKNAFYLCYYTQVYASLDSEDVIYPFGNDGYAYAKVREHTLPGGSFDNMMELATKTYSEDIIDDAFRFNRHNFFLNQYIEDIPLYVEYQDAYYWYEFAGVRLGSLIQPITDDATHDILHVILDNVTANVEFDRIKVDGDRATGYVLAWSGEESKTKIWSLPVEFIRTADGWRLSDCVLFRLYYTPEIISAREYVIVDDSLYAKYGVIYEPYYDESPSTGDVSGERVAVIGAVSLACIIPAACLMRRRRRNTF